MAQESKFFDAQLGNREMLLKRNAEQYEKIVNYETEVHQKALQKREKAEKDCEKRIERYKKEGLYSQAATEEAQLERLKSLRIDAEIQLENKRKEVHAQALKAAEVFEINHYKRMSASEKRAYHDSIHSQLKEREEFRKSELSAEQDQLKKLKAERAKIKDKRGAGKAETEETDKKIAAAQAKIAQLNKEQAQQEAAKAASNKFSKSELLLSKEARAEKTKRDFDDNAEKIVAAQDNVEEKKAKLNSLEEKWTKENEKRRKKIEDAKKKGDTDEVRRLQQIEDEERAAFEQTKEYKEAEKELTEANAELLDAKAKGIADTLKDSAIVGAGKALSKAADNISANIDAMYGQQGRMMGRLQGSGENWGLNVVGVTAKVGMSGVVSQKDVVAKMVQLVDSGVAYNLEMRAFLAETSENIASTFDAANGTLLRLIRVQQSDTTAARLGMEASLTKLFNQYFKDTSYLTDSGPSDAVKSAILDATATMDKNEGLEFEFTVQKWLGSLYSLGMSSEAVQAIAEGINYIGTGNVSALSGNTALTTLFAMSAAKGGGKSYADMLTSGLTSEDTNDLLRGMIEYLAQIAESQENNVTKAAYADLFGMSLTDLSTFTSLKSEELTNLYEKTTSYNSLMNETQKQLLLSLTRVSMGQLVDTAIENAEVGAASLIGSNPVTYGMWKSLALLKEYVGEVKIPGVTGMGTGIASGLDLLNLAQTGMAGMGLLGSLVAGIGSMLTGGALNMHKWSYDEYTQRGNTLSLLAAGTEEDTSVSATIGVGSSSGSDASSVSMEQGKESGMEASGTTSEEMEEGKEVPQKILDALNGETTPTVISLLQEIDNRLDPNRVFYTAIAGVLSSGTADRVFELSAQVANSKAQAEAKNSAEMTGGVANLVNTVTAAVDGLGGKTASSNDIIGSEGISDIIQTAVGAAVKAVLSEYPFGIPVQVTGGVT